MNFYPHHLGDYAKDTKHLSVTEHGAYRLLMDHYYSTESPLPDSFSALFRICGASGKVEKKAVESVIKHFFVLKGEAYHQKRIDLELVDYDERVDTNKRNGLKGGRPPKQKPTGLSVGSDSVMKTETQKEPKNNPNQKPEARSQKPNTEINPSPDSKPKDSRHSPIVKFWGTEFKERFGTDYSFHDTRQFKELQRFLDGNPALTTDEFMDVANEAWKASEDKFRKAVKDSRTLSGICQNWNAIRAELETGRTLFVSKPQREDADTPCV